MAHTAFLLSNWDKLLIAVDAKCGEIYWSIYEYNQESSLILPHQEILCTPTTITRPLGLDWSGIGDGWEQYGTQLTMHLGFKPKNIDPSQLPNAKALLHLAKIKYNKGEFTPLTEALPHYFR
jgi:tRNA A37 threonylcarbamoyladenosine modification protein TsaB